MRIIQLTAGTGSFYCGTCMRDNALVVELRRQGHDAMIASMYLPMTLDEAPASTGAPLFYGGINVYLQQKLSLFRRTPRWLDRLLDAPAMLRAAGKQAGSTQAAGLGDLTISTLRGEEGNQAKELDRLVEWLAEDGHPDVVCLSNALFVGLARRIKQETGAPVVCTLQGEDTFLDSFPEPDRTHAWDAMIERAADVDAFIAVSQYYGDVMRARLRLPAERLHVVHNGISLAGYAAAPAPPDPPVLGYLARMHASKGLETLVTAYTLIRKRGRIPNLKLRIAGACTASDEPLVRKMRDILEHAGVAEDAEFLPNLDRDHKIAFLQSLSALSVPATYGESFGLYVIEALAAGVPVVQPRHAAFPELIQATGGGVLCEPNDPAALAEAIEALLADPLAAKGTGERGRQAVLDRFSVESMASGAVRVFESVGSRASGPAVSGSRGQ